jgi:large subunit ribosomal protein L23
MKLAQDIIIKPVVTEKSMDLLAAGKYTFKVAKNSNKAEIARAVEELFNVQVTKVNTLNVRGRKKRMGRFEGTTPSWKKAIVTIAAEPTKPGVDGKKRKGSIEFFESLI